MTTTHMLGRSVRKDGRVDHAPPVQADDVHAVIEALGAGPVEMFASRCSGTCRSKAR